MILSFALLLCSAVDRVTIPASSQQTRGAAPKKQSTALHLAALKNDVEQVRALIIKAPASVDATDGLGSTALHLAALKNRLEVARVLLESAAVDARDGRGYTALHVAALRGHVEMVRMLLKGGAAVDAPSIDDGTTALHVSSSESRVEMTVVLLENGASPDSRDREGRTALHRATSALACVSQSPRIGRATPPSLARISEIYDGFRGMDVAVKSVPTKGLGLVAQRRLSPGSAVAYYYTQMYEDEGHVNSNYALGRPQWVSDIFNGSFPPAGGDGIPYLGPYANEVTEGSGQSYNAVIRSVSDDLENKRSLHALIATRPVAAGEEITWWYKQSYRREGYRAASPEGEPRHCDLGDNVKVARMLLGAGAAVDAANAKGGTALHDAAGHNDVEMARMLLESGAAIDPRGAALETALHVAASRGHAEVARVLVENGAAVDAKLKSQGSTALHICAAEGHLEVARVLLNKRGGASTLLEAVDDEGRTALQVATSSGQKRVARLLKSRAPSNAEEL